MAELIDALERRWPGMRDRLCDPGPRLREHINVFVDGERATLATPLGPGATVHVIPAVSGGSALDRALQASAGRASSGSNASVRSATASRPS